MRKLAPIDLRLTQGQTVLFFDDISSERSSASLEVLELSLGENLARFRVSSPNTLRELEKRKDEVLEVCLSSDIGKRGIVQMVNVFIYENRLSAHIRLSDIPKYMVKAE